MDKTVSIYDAKSNLSKLVKQAAAGKTIYIGAYGQPQAILAPLPQKKPLEIGIYAHKYRPGDFDDHDIIESDPEVAQEFEDSVNRPMP